MKHVIAFCLAIVTTQAGADPVPLSQLSSYLNSLQVAEANFVQINADGSQSTGRLSINRPGRARFDYDDPSDVVVVVGAGNVAIFDEFTTDQPEQYPLRRTPLSLILARDVNLEGAKMVVDHTASGDRTLVVAQDPDRPEDGQIGLYFQSDPIRLDEWIIVNGNGEQTRIRLSEFVARDRLPTQMFSIRSEIAKRTRFDGD